MARQLKRLTTRTVAALKKPGRHADGQNRDAPSLAGSHLRRRAELSFGLFFHA
jgi:hypothetical protein